METTENIIAIKNGLETTRSILSGRIQNELRGFSGCKAKATILQFQYDTIGNQLEELYKSALYNATVQNHREAHKPYSRALENTRGLNGQQILIALSKQSA
jgi:hypothetical protein